MSVSLSKVIKLKPITPADLPFLARVYASTRQEELAVTGWSDEQIALFLASQFNAQHDHYSKHYNTARFCIVLYRGAPVGRLYVDVWREEIRIVDIALLPEHRRQGIGTFLLEELIKESLARQLPLSIHVEVNNPAMSLYKRLGFVYVSEYGVYHLMRRAATPEGTG